MRGCDVLRACVTCTTNLTTILDIDNKELRINNTRAVTEQLRKQNEEDRE